MGVRNRPMMLGMINSAWEQHGIGLVRGLRLTRRIGFDSVDIFQDPLDPGAGRRIETIRRTCRELGLPIVSVVGVSVGLIDLNPSVRRFHLERSKRYLDMGARLGARNYLMVLGEYIWEQQVIPPAVQWGWAVEACRALGDHARRRGLEVVLELEPFRLSLLSDMHAMVRFLKDVSHPRVKANIDVSHMVLSGTPPRSLRKLGGRAGHVHLSDCDGRVHGDLPPGRGVVDFLPYLREIKRLSISGAISIELEYSPDPDRIIEWVEEAYRETARLLEKAGIRRSSR
jgi:D-psicose/D-tagatose/L-ribulose 3-epimerase